MVVLLLIVISNQPAAYQLFDFGSLVYIGKRVCTLYTALYGFASVSNPLT